MDPAANNSGQPVAAGLAQDSTANAENSKEKPCHATATAERDAALGRIAGRVDPAWRAAADAALLAAIDRAQAGAATVDDARAAVPPPARPRWWCAIPYGLRSRGLIRCVGVRQGGAPVTHAGVLRLWARVEVSP